MKILNGSLLRDTEAIGKMDPFIEIVYLGKKYRTKTIHEGGKNPKWNESLEIHIESIQDKIKIICYDEDSIDNDLVGEVECPLSQFLI